jgi:hypothetical protein
LNPGYLADIERAFLQHAGRGLMLSAADVELVRQWDRAGIPLEAVHAALVTCFGRPGLDRTRVRGLAFIRREVEAEAALRRSLGIGARPVEEPSAPGTPPLIDRLSERLRGVADASLPPAPDLIREAVVELNAGGPATNDDVWERWSRIRPVLLARLWSALSEAERATLSARVSTGLEGERRRVDPAHFEQTWAAHRDRALAARFGLPDDIDLYTLDPGT